MSALQQLHAMVGRNENILWSAKPMKKCFILESIFNPLLPFAILWALFDGFSIFVLTRKTPSAESSLDLIFLLLFFSLHLMPVWIYLGGVLFSFLRYKNAAFIVTDKGVYISSGLFSLNFNHKPFMEISRIHLHQGFIDRMLGVGDIVIGERAKDFGDAPQFVQDVLSRFSANKTDGTLSIYDISDYQQVFSLVKELQQNIYSDVQYPNDLRPKENHGYRTTYIPPENK
ncbi:MAG: PH domain-containing protein [Elusimicrobiaceae bacterium]|nr:PH domain-containing protein [Elusimicrobiaceae bacterium]